MGGRDERRAPGPDPGEEPRRLDERGLVEEGLLDPSILHGPALPPHVLTIRPFLWIVVGWTVAHTAFWAYFGTLFADAAFGYDASAAQMALLLGTFSLPFVVVTPLLGMLVDRWSPKWLLLIGFAVLAAAIPVAALATSLVWLGASIAVVGIAAAAIDPARSSLTGLLVPKDQLVQANGMMSASTHSALLVGTIGSGLLLGATGNADVVYTVAAIVAVAGLPFFLLIPDLRQSGERPAMSFRDLGQGVVTSWRHPELRLLLFLALLGYVIMNLLFSLEPILIRDVIGGGQEGVQFLWAANGFGAMVGALLVSRIREGVGLELLLIAGGFVLAGLGMMVYAGLAIYAVAVVATMLIGAGFSLFFSAALALVQRAAGEEEMGRVTAVLGVLSEGTGLLSSIVLAGVGTFVAVQPVLVGSGIVLALGGLGGLRRLRRLQAAGLAEPAPPGAPIAGIGAGRRRREP
ncbi:MAG: MFS transporter [Actinomycetota bacterium]